VLDGPIDPVVGEVLERAAGRLVLLSLTDSPAGAPLPGSARVDVVGETGATGRLWPPGGSEDRALILDALSRATAAGIARDLASLTVPATAGGLPDSARLLELPAAGVHFGPGSAVGGEWDRSRARLLAVLGAGPRGPHQIDLVSDGPHALIAGTTGS